MLINADLRWNWMGELDADWEAFVSGAQMHFEMIAVMKQNNGAVRGHCCLPAAPVEVQTGALVLAPSPLWP